jgi:Survival motor neuron (SMN) interacting protein 1 (SIP1)
MSGPPPCLPYTPKNHHKRQRNERGDVHKVRYFELTDNDNDNGDEPPASWDLSAITNASEYLSRVSRQARGLPDIMQAVSHNHNKKDIDVDQKAASNSKHETNNNMHDTNHPTDKHTAMSSVDSTQQSRSSQKSPTSQESKPSSPQISSHNKQSLPAGSIAQSIQYLCSTQRQLIPPPTHQHTPRDMHAFKTCVLTSFVNLRNYLDDLYLQGVSGKQDVSRRRAVPPLKDYDAWTRLVHGQGSDDIEATSADVTESSKDRIYAAHIHTADKTAEHSDSVTNTIQSPRDDVVEAKNDNTIDESVSQSTDDTTKKQAAQVSSKDPTTSFLLQMDQVMVRKLLYHVLQSTKEAVHAPEDTNVPTKTLETTTTDHQGSTEWPFLWTFALLSRLEKPLHRDDEALLRQLLHLLTVRRSQLQLHKREDSSHLQAVINRANGATERGGNICEPNESSVVSESDRLAQLNTLIVIVAVYFQQAQSYEEVMQVQR